MEKPKIDSYQVVYLFVIAYCIFKGVLFSTANLNAAAYLTLAVVAICLLLLLAKKE